MSPTEEATSLGDEIISRGSQIYEELLKSLLEPEQTGRFVAIEPETGRYFVGDTDGEALFAAHQAMPESQFYVKRVGFDITHKLGGYGFGRRKS